MRRIEDLTVEISTDRDFKQNPAQNLAMAQDENEIHSVNDLASRNMRG